MDGGSTAHSAVIAHLPWLLGETGNELPFWIKSAARATHVIINLTQPPLSLC